MPDNSNTPTGSPRTAAETSVTALRVVVAAVLIIHGVARTALGIVDDFGGFLGNCRFPGRYRDRVGDNGNRGISADWRWRQADGLDRSRCTSRRNSRSASCARARIRRVVCRRSGPQRRRVQRRTDFGTAGGCIRIARAPVGEARKPSLATGLAPIS